MDGRMVLTEPAGGILERASWRLHSFFCGLHGHDMVLRVEPGRLSLQCMSCHYVTPGWTIKESQALHSDGSGLGASGLVEQNAQ